ncbi:2,3-dihydroxybiphenyl 1,2-dioxygenase [Bhargavaea cecembensis]|uniref:2,3-dihydroxybiphenyl 1,2-dioxygenase n=1 Tax=Bhargavaea cecembensis TaxID=394098 RepID=A0A161ST02_9BACL|nr:VOC family protein [Bhargavaea cecembensis]KZE38750.1 2,3-dihydroxybiphenyl 1,2-dioxygenase [Bhargavaea cecembensis]
MAHPEIAKLGHVALVSSDLEKSLWFFKEVIGLEETEARNGVHYLRAWGDFQHHTLSLEAGESGQVRHIGWRTKRPEDVQAFRKLLEQDGVEVEAVPAGTTPGIGEAIRFPLPSGHQFELYYDVEKPKADEHRRSVLKNQTYKAWAKGVSPRRFDHVNIHTDTDAALTYDFLREQLGFKMREYVRDNDGNVLAGWMSVTSLVHDLAFIQKPSLPSPARLHHISYWSDDSQDILRAADILKENGLRFIGPGKHGISQALYLYVMDPGSGCRVELFTGGYLIFEPDWEPVEWTLEERDLGNTYWGDSVSDKEDNNITIMA